MATSEAGMTSEQELTDTAEEGETWMDTSDPHSPPQHSEDSNSRNEDTDTTSLSADLNSSALSATPVQSTSGTPATPTTPVTPTTPTTPGRRDHLPNRHGIAWRKGERVEAMDYLNKWYPAKIMDIDEEEKAVLIHFEGWNSRYDEWTLMTSEGIRPLTRHSERKERGRKKLQEFRVGEKVLAKWTDCKMYPAKIISIHSNGTMEVIFYDGFQKTVQEINVKPLLEKQKGRPFPSPKETQRIKPEVKRRSTEKVRSSSCEEKSDQGALSDRRRKHKLIVAGSFLAKRERSLSAPSLSERQKKHKTGIRRGFGMRSSPVKARRDSHLKTSPGLPKKTLSPKLSQLQPKKETAVNVKRAKKRALSLPTEERVGGQRLSPGQPKTPTSAPAVPAKRSKSTEKEKAVAGGLAPKEFVIETDHNLFKCMIPGCSKSFRKENLLDYHIKYYHMEEIRTPQPPASRTKRRKTSSICSTDSDISVSSKGKTTPGEGSASKRKRHISSASDVLKEESVEEIKKEVIEGEEVKPSVSTPITPVQTLTPDLKVTPGEVSISEDKGQEENEDELAGDEVVNCLCGYNEENGLMIQCDVCLCWQHATCFNIKYEELPSKYICFVCLNPPGVRDSRRYIYDQDWFKSGQLPAFTFLDTRQTEENMDRVKSTNSLISDVLNVKAVLHSIKQAIHVPSNENHKEMATWRRICEDRRRKARAAARLASKSEPIKQECDPEPETSTNQDEQTELEEADVKQEVKFSLDGEDIESQMPAPKEESPISKSMACQASLDLSSSLDRSDDKSFDASAADNDSDTSTMTASESSIGYISSLPVGQSSSSLVADDTHTGGLDEDERRIQEKMLQELDEDEPVGEIEPEECERSLLLHIVRVQAQMNDRLDLLEEQIAAMEQTESGPTGAAAAAASAPPASQSSASASSTAAAAEAPAVLKDVPVLKKSLHSLVRDLGKVKTMAAYH